MPSDKINIELSSNDAKLFRLFREHQDKFKQLLEGGVFEQRVGSAVLHSDGKHFRKIEITIVSRV